MDQTLTAYKIFHTVAKTGNISRAANELFISQPAISKAIAKLENNLNVTLFVRNSRGVSLTDEGKLLYDHLTIAFESIDIAEEQIHKVHELEMGQIRIGVSTTLCKYLLLPYLKKFVEQYPHIKVLIECRSTFHTLKLLEEGKIDIGLIGAPGNIKGIHFDSVTTIQDTFVTTKSYLDNLMLRDSQCTIENVLSHGNLMLLDEKNVTRKYIEDYFQENRIITNQILEINTMDLLIEFAKIGLGIACVVEDFVMHELSVGSLIQIPLAKPLKRREIGFAYNTKSYLSESAKKFINFYKKN